MTLETIPLIYIDPKLPSPDSQQLQELQQEQKQGQLDIKHWKQDEYAEYEFMQNKLLQTWKMNQPKVCSVCLDSAESDSNILLTCSNVDCDVCVHQECYGLRDISIVYNTTFSSCLSSWKCNTCLPSPIPSIISDECIGSSKSSSIYNIDKECALCPDMGGALKQAVNGTWVHLTCAIWHPHVQINDLLQMSQIDISHISPSSWSKECYLCDDSVGAQIGACVQCSVSECTKSFHVSCGMKWNLFSSASLNSNLGYDYFCHLHAPNRSEFKMNSWDVWRSKKAKLWEVYGNEEEQALIRYSFIPRSIPKTFILPSNWLWKGGDIFRDNSILTPKRLLSFKSSYALYDYEREFYLIQMKEESQRLSLERRQLEIRLLELQVSRHTTQTQITMAQDKVTLQKSTLQFIQTLLLKLYKKCTISQIDLSCFLIPDETSPKSIRSPSSNNVVDFFMQFNTQSCHRYQGPEFPNIVGSNLFESFVNLSGICGLPKITAPVSSNGLCVCSYCKTRMLPLTAPVYPRYRDYLLSCPKCSIKSHLCCLPVPLSTPPIDGKWECDVCMAKEKKGSVDNVRKQQLPIQISKAQNNSKGSIYSLSSMDEDETSIHSEPQQRSKKRIRKNSSNERSTKLSSPKQRKPSQMNASNSSFRSNLSQCSSAPKLETECGPKIPMADAKRELFEIAGSEPLFPQMLIDSQTKGTPENTVLRAFVFDAPTDEDKEQMKKVAMWRVFMNIPPSADSRDVVSLKLEGESFGFGKFGEAFKCGSNNVSLSPLFAHSSGVVDCGDCSIDHSAGDDKKMNDAAPEVLAAALTTTEDDVYLDEEVDDDEIQSDSSDDFDGQSCSKRQCTTTSKKTSQSKGLKAERVSSRWDGDLYKPFWTRGNGKLKEGWCALCEPGQWLKTKTSVYWYHMHNFHGVSSIGGTFFTTPLEKRVSAQTGLKEGMCHQCRKWIPIQGDKPVNVEEIYWFKHAQKCHRYDSTDSELDKME